MQKRTSVSCLFAVQPDIKSQATTCFLAVLCVFGRLTVPAFTLAVSRCSPPHPPLLLTCCCLYLSISPSRNMAARCTCSVTVCTQRTSLSEYACNQQQSFIYFIGGINTVSHDGCRNNVKLIQNTKPQHSQCAS